MQHTESGSRALGVPEAARLVGISPQALRKRLARAGALRREVHGGRVLALVDAATLAELYPAARQGGPPLVGHPGTRVVPSAEDAAHEGGVHDAGGTRAAAPLASEVERLRRELELERVARARLEGELAVAARVEAAAQRFADRAEEKLAESRREALSLARALGQVEQERDQARALLAAPRGFLSRVLSRVPIRVRHESR